MKLTNVFSIGLLGLANFATAAVQADWARRSIYQTMTDRFALPDGSTDKKCDLMKYCGGTYTGLIKKLDYIQGMGFTAIQISPHPKNLPQDTPYGEAYHGYWVQDNYAMNEHFGTAEDLNNLIEELHKRDMYLILGTLVSWNKEKTVVTDVKIFLKDVVINNSAVKINGTMNQKQDIDYKQFHPFNDKKYYHPYWSVRDFHGPLAHTNLHLQQYHELR
jgi:alpha-amylase